MNVDFDSPFYEKYGTIAGIDESGVTAIAGPIIAACVVMPRGQTHNFQNIDDCKMVSEKNIPRLAALIKLYCPYGIGVSPPLEIDVLGVAHATKLAMIRAIESCKQRFPETIVNHYLVDGKNVLTGKYSKTEISKGDTKSLCVASASIIAKDRRDTFMTLLGGQRPEYNFAKNKGYASEEHLQGLDKLGIWTSVHRICTPPIKAKRTDSEDLILRRTTWIVHTDAASFSL